MGSMHDAKLLGGIGSILMLIVPVVGQILVLLAAKYISDNTNDRSVFDNLLYAMIFGIIASIATVMIVYGSLVSFIINPMGALAGIIIGLIVGFIFYLLSAIFLRKGFNRIADLFNINYFRTAATLYFIGAILMIIIVGAFIILIAEIFMIVAFFSLPEQLPTQAPPPPPSSLPPPPI